MWTRDHRDRAGSIGNVNRTGSVVSVGVDWSEARYWGDLCIRRVPLIVLSDLSDARSMMDNVA